MTHSRYPYLKTSDSNTVLTYQLDGSATQVSVDTATPANSKPLPVKVVSATGQNIDIHTENANFAVQLSDEYDNVSDPKKIPDVVRLGDGANRLVFDVNGVESTPESGANGSIKVSGLIQQDLSGNAFTDSHRQNLLLDQLGRLHVYQQLTDADGVAPTDNSTTIGAVVDLIPSDTLVEGDKITVKTDVNGRVWVAPNSAISSDSIDAENPIKAGTRTIDPDALATTVAGRKLDALSDFQGRLIVNPQSHGARNAAIVENPFIVGGSYTADMDAKGSLTTAMKSTIAVDDKERVYVRNAVIYNSTLPVYVDGDQGMQQLDVNGRQLGLPHGQFMGDHIARNALASRTINDKDYLVTDDKGRLLTSMEGLFVADIDAEVDLTDLQKKELLIDEKGRLLTKEYDKSVVAVVDDASGPLWDTAEDVPHNIPQLSANAVQIRSALPSMVTEILVIEDIGAYMALYSDAARTALLCCLPLGGGEVKVKIPAGTVIFIGALEANDITAGKMAINFLG